MVCSRKERYSLELGKIHEAPNMDVFDFKYDFYDERFKCKFEEKFIDYYYYDEIGFETVKRFKHFLRSRLNLRMPYYTQLYQTELAAEGIDFLLNKDLTETIIRDLDTEDKLEGSTATQTEDIIETKDGSETTNRGTSTTETTIDSNVKTDGTNKVEDTISEKSADTLVKGTTVTEKPNTTTTVTNNSTVNDTASNIADGVASASLDPRFLTAVDQKTNNGTDKTTVEGTNITETTGTDTDTVIKTGNNKSDTTIENNVKTIENNVDRTTLEGATVVKNTGNKTDKGTSKGQNKEDKTGKEHEITKIISQGNIGVTSSAELLEKWRNIIINLDEMIILDCRDLFMGIF